MDGERIREMALKLPHVVEGVSWGHHLVFWVGDKTIGGKMFAMTDLDLSGAGVISIHAGPERFHELVEVEGVIPAPYMARIYWVTIQRWHAFRDSEYEELLANAHALIYAKLPQKTKDVLALEPKAQKKLIAERKKLLKQKAESGVVAVKKKSPATAKKTAPKATQKLPRGK